MQADKKKAGTRSRTYDAARTKETILDAAEGVFAELGFSAARIDAIAKESGYNKSLIYQYFGDKLGLYTEVVKRADQVGDQATGQAFAKLLHDGTLVSDPAKFMAFLDISIRSMYDFLLEYPRYRKILFWEAAEEWKTWNRLPYRPDDWTQLRETAQAAKDNGLLRKDFAPDLLPLLLLNVTTAAIQSLKRIGVMPEDADTPRRRQETCDQLVRFVVHGVMEPSLL